MATQEETTLKEEINALQADIEPSFWDLPSYYFDTTDRYLAGKAEKNATLSKKIRPSERSINTNGPVFLVSARYQHEKSKSSWFDFLLFIVASPILLLHYFNSNNATQDFTDDEQRLQDEHCNLLGRIKDDEWHARNFSADNQWAQVSGPVPQNAVGNALEKADNAIAAAQTPDGHPTDTAPLSPPSSEVKAAHRRAAKLSKKGPSEATGEAKSQTETQMLDAATRAGAAAAPTEQSPRSPSPADKVIRQIAARQAQELAPAATELQTGTQTTQDSATGAEAAPAPQSPRSPSERHRAASPAAAPNQVQEPTATAESPPSTPNQPSKRGSTAWSSVKSNDTTPVQELRKASKFQPLLQQGGSMKRLIKGELTTEESKQPSGDQVTGRGLSRGRGFGRGRGYACAPGADPSKHPLFGLAANPGAQPTKPQSTDVTGLNQLPTGSASALFQGSPTKGNKKRKQGSRKGRHHNPSPSQKGKSGPRKK